jgi:hypothetical protein
VKTWQSKYPFNNIIDEFLHGALNLISIFNTQGN